MSGMQRRKGAGGERELAAILTLITGHTITRRVRQHGGDDDLVGLPGWAIECKRAADVTPAGVRRWWEQAVAQAERTGQRPALFYRVDRRAWRAAWSPTADTALMVEADIDVWWALQSLPWPAVPPQPDRGSCAVLARPGATVEAQS
jgi:Holliday junction resolvase